MTRSRSIWFACITLGVLLALIAVGRAGAKPPDEKALPGPAHASVWHDPLSHGDGVASLSASGAHAVPGGKAWAPYSSSGAVDTRGAPAAPGRSRTVMKTETGGQGHK